jgi:predicted nucleic-acid-binding protein
VTEPQALIDANLILRFLLGDNEVQSPIAYKTIQAIERGDVRAETTATVIFEAIHVMTSVYKMDRAIVADRMSRLLQISGLAVEHRAALTEALGLWLSRKRLSFPDAFHLVLTSMTKHKRIVSFDRGLDGCLAGVTRVEQFP